MTMTDKTLPFTQDDIERIMGEHPTPFHLYDEEGIRETARQLNSAFSWAPGFRNYFAVKALPNPYVLKILRQEGMGADCSSLPELLLAERAGINGKEIMFTSNNTPAGEFQYARQLGAVINLDDITHLEFLERHAGIPELLCFRYNPGDRINIDSTIGRPTEAKYGLTPEQMIEAYRIARDEGIKRFGLHAMVASPVLDPHYFVDKLAPVLFDLMGEISSRVGIQFEFLNMGGGIGIPYRPEQEPVDLTVVGQGIQQEYQRRKLHPLRILMENGRMVTGPHGYLVTMVRHVMRKHKNFVGVDASMANLMRPGMYGAYHHITVVGKEHLPHDHKYDVVGSICENIDKFAIDRLLPAIEPGDVLVIHDTGAHGHAMGFNYNGKLRSAELLQRPDGEILQIRRKETVEDYFTTFDFEAVDRFQP